MCTKRNERRAESRVEAAAVPALHSVHSLSLCICMFCVCSMFTQADPVHAACGTEDWEKREKRGKRGDLYVYMSVCPAGDFVLESND